MEAVPLTVAETVEVLHIADPYLHQWTIDLDVRATKQVGRSPQVVELPAKAFHNPHYRMTPDVVVALSETATVADFEDTVDVVEIAGNFPEAGEATLVHMIGIFVGDTAAVLWLLGVAAIAGPSMRLVMAVRSQLSGFHYDQFVGL